MDRLFTYFIGLDREDIPMVGIQDVALCDLWYSAGAPFGRDIEQKESIPKNVSHWKETVEKCTPETEGRRRQPLLRDLIDAVHENKLRDLERDELDLLVTVYELACSAKQEDAFTRVIEALRPHIDAIQMRQASLGPEPELPTLFAKMRVVDTSDIEQAKAREVHYLAGVELPGRGPVLVQRGHVRVLGDVPAGATLVVEEGSCVIDGFVMGRVAVSGGCEIQENISGVAIARNGDIRARNIVDGAFVVSKRGWVHCRRAQRPKIIFAGECIRISQKAILGRMISKSIRVSESIEGGEVHVGSDLEAERLHHSHDRPLDIVFRKRLSCKDYGEDPGRPMAVDVSAAMHLREKLQFAQRKTSFALGEAEQIASNTLTYLLVGEEMGGLMDSTIAAQRRLNVLNRIVLSLHTLYAGTERELEAPEAGDSASSGRESHETSHALDNLDIELDELDEDIADDDPLREERMQIARMRRELDSAGPNRKGLHYALAGLGKKLAHWLDEADGLRRQIERNDKLIQENLRAKHALADADSEAPKLVSLQHLILKLRQASPSDPMAMRLNSSFVSLMLRTMHAKVETAKKLRNDIESMRRKFAEAREKIWQEYQMSIPTGDDSLIEMTASGRYDPGVRLHAAPHFLQAGGPSTPGASIVSHGSGEDVMTYVCRSGFIEQRTEEMASAAEPVAT